MKNDNQNRTLYVSPEAYVLELINEGVLCDSDKGNEDVDEIFGVW